MIGKQFGEWTIIAFDKKIKYAIYYICRCSCGIEKSIYIGNLTSGKSKSCGHLKLNPSNDLVGQVFGRLSVISWIPHDPSKVKFRGSRWLCRCDCGTEVIKRTNELTSGNTKSCGCLNDESRKIIGHSNMEDLTGKQFGELTVLEFYQSINQRAEWICQCSCGEIVIVNAGHLKDGHTQSCGHIKSKGELAIKKILVNNEINFEPQYTFADLKSNKGYPLKFDFAIFSKSTKDIEMLLEYQGQQHFHPVEYFGGQQAFDIQQENDNKKRQYAKEHNIPLVEISTNYKKISVSDLCLDSYTQYKVKGE